ncbi:MAG: Gp15 family bacteriophage protein [Liquorilactobacillus satsumensis]
MEERAFEWNGKRYELNFTYDNILRFFQLLDDDSLNKYEKISLQFQLLVGEGLQVPLEKMIDVIEYAANLISESSYQPTASNPVKMFDYEQDSEAIYASFLQQYGIDLIKEKGKLDYFKFRALFTNLSSNTPFQQIVHIRSKDPSKHIEDREYVQQLNIQQQTFAVRKTPEEIETEKQAQLGAALSNL